jgi:hypothetical protein
MSREFGYYLIFPWMLLLTVYVVFPGNKQIECKSENKQIDKELVSPDEISIIAYDNVLLWRKQHNTVEVLAVINKSLEDGKITKKEYEDITNVVDVARYGNAKYELLNKQVFPRL